MQELQEVAAHPLLTHHFPVLQELVMEAEQPYESLDHAGANQADTQVGVGQTFSWWQVVVLMVVVMVVVVCVSTVADAIEWG